MQETVSCDALIDRLLIQNVDVRKIINVVNACFTNPRTISKTSIKNRITRLKQYKAQLDVLKQIPKIEQRSEEWFAVRQKIITASEFAQALGKAKFGTQREFFQKKCNHEEAKPFNSSSPPLKWGVMFEPVANDVYKKRTCNIVHEFGLLQHPTIPFFGASPDGITDNGIMVEYKCPYQRKITGEIPLQYFYQIQGQLSVCNLQECDYVECEFIDCNTMDEWIHDIDFDTCQEAGIIVEDNESGQYQYSHIMTGDNAINLEKEASEWLNDRTGILHFWRLNVFNIVRVYRDEPFLKEQFCDLETVWNKVLEYKGNKDLYMVDVGYTGRKRKTTGQKDCDEEAPIVPFPFTIKSKITENSNL